MALLLHGELPGRRTGPGLLTRAGLSNVRIVVFTGNPLLERSPWWPILLGTPGVEDVLVCRQVWSRGPRDVLRRLRRNVAKHGLIFVPYRLAVLAWALLRRLFASRDAASIPAPQGNARCEVLKAVDIHAPEVVARIREWRADVGLSVGAPILRSCLFRLPTAGTANLHLGQLPEFRGAPPGFWELYTGARAIGATVHWIDEGLDTGPVITHAEAPIYDTDTLGRVEARATELGVRVLAAALNRLAAGTASGTPQRSRGRTFRFPTLTQRARLASRLALRRLGRRIRSPRLVAKGVAELAALAVVRPMRDLVRTLTATHPVRVFTFHRISDVCRDGMTVPPDVFRRQVEYVKRYHEVVPLDRALELLRSGARLRRPLAVLTFDDGYRSVFERAWPILADVGVVGCCFVCSDFVGTDRRFAHDAESPVRDHFSLMGWEELQALHQAGWTIGGHTATHARLSLCGEAALRDELTRPLAALRDRLGLTAVGMAFPFGRRGDVPAGFADMVRRLGYTACFSDYGGENSPPMDSCDLRRIELGGDHESLAWRASVHGIDLGRWRVWWDRTSSGGERVSVA